MPWGGTMTRKQAEDMADFAANECAHGLREMLYWISASPGTLGAEENIRMGAGRLREGIRVALLFMQGWPNR